MDAQAVGYDLTITPSDNRGNVGQPKILTVIVTGTLIAQFVIKVDVMWYLLNCHVDLYNTDLCQTLFRLFVFLIRFMCDYCN